MKKYFEVYAQGLIYTSVCTNLGSKSATLELNRYHPTGISSSWSLADEDFADGSPNPHTCENNPKYKHYLFSC